MTLSHTTWSNAQKVSHARELFFTEISESPWVFRVTPLSSLYALLNSLEQLDSVLKPRSHTDPTHTHIHTHLLTLTHIVSLSGHFSPQCCRGTHYTITISRLSTNEHDPSKGGHPTSLSCLPSTSLSVPPSPSPHSGWSLKVSSHHFLCSNALVKS